MDYAERLKQNLTQSDCELVLMRACTDCFEDFFGHLKTYIRLRYVIDDTDFWTDDLPELGRFSMKHQQDVIGDDDEALQDTSLNCAGATSAETKQILLLMKLKRDLNVTLEPEFMGLAKSVQQVAERLFAQLS